MAVVVGIFRDYEQAQASVRDLIASGFSSEAISVVSRQDPARAAEALPDPAPPEADTSGAAIGVGTGALLGGALAAMGLAVPGVGPILAAGPLAAALAGASIGAAAGGVIGVLVDLGVPGEEAQQYADAIRRGDTLVTVTVDDAMADRAVTVMRGHHAVGVEERQAGQPRVTLYGRRVA
jgi:hypothetical protein